MNPLLLLDEIEKCGHSSEHGSPLDALLQALDPGQNRQFKDLYLGMPVDISEVFFIATANDISAMPEPLLDCFHIIEVAEYSMDEKLHIMPFLLDQIRQEYDLAQVPSLSADVSRQLERNVLPYVGLRRIKQVLCVMKLCIAMIWMHSSSTYILAVLHAQIYRIKIKCHPSGFSDGFKSFLPQWRSWLLGLSEYRAMCT